MYRMCCSKMYCTARIKLWCYVFTIWLELTLSFNIGGIFNGIPSPGNIEEWAFKQAVSMYAEELGEKTVFSRVYSNKMNSFETREFVCEMFKDGVAAIIGPTFGDTVQIVQSMCDAKEIPNIQMSWNPKRSISSCMVNFYPHPDALSKAYIELLYHWKWKEFTVIYENNESLLRITGLLKPENNRKAIVKLRQLEAVEDDYRPMLRRLRDEGTKNMILDCSIEKLPEVLKQAQQVGLMGSEHNYIITNLNLHTVDLKPYQYSGVNITGFSLFSTFSSYPEEIAQNLTEFARGDRNFTVQDITVEAALIYDAMNMFVTAVKNSDIKVSETPCNSDDTSGFGYTLINFMKSLMLDGVTGLVKFDLEGFRSDFELQINELTYDGPKRTGIWNITSGLKILKTYDDVVKPVESINRDIRNMTFTVIISLTEPYGMRKKSSDKLQGNDQFEGYGVDLIYELSVKSGFKYNFIVQDDGQSGDRIEEGEKKGQWTGMIGAVMSGKADLAVADITITKDREKAVDFASPFMDLGIAILYQKPIQEPAGFFSFLDPFHNEVWIYVITAYISVSLMFFIMGRISPYEWRNPYPCVQDPEELENQFTLLNSFFFTIGALMQQGSDIAPVSMSTRLAAGFWWFFTLIMVSCYTANLAAFLSIENSRSDITSVDDLANQNQIKYGAKRNGSTFNFFRDSKKRIYEQMYNYMTAYPEVMTANSKEGVRRVENGSYAFLMESTSIDYVIERNCSLIQVGKNLDSKGYGIAMRKGSWYLNTFSQLILNLQESGRLAYLKRKWWKEKYSGSCQRTEPNEAETLGMPNVGGVFIVLIAGIIIAIPIAFIELLLFVNDTSKEENVSFKDRLLWEIKFILRCHGSSKPAGMGTSEDASSD